MPAVVGGAGDAGGVGIAVLPVDGLFLGHVGQACVQLLLVLLIERPELGRLLLHIEDPSHGLDLVDQVRVVPAGDHQHLDTEGFQHLLVLLIGAVLRGDEDLSPQIHDLLVVQLALALADHVVRVELAPIDPVLGGIGVHGDDAVNGAAGADQLAVVAVGHHGPLHRPGDLHFTAQAVHHHLRGGLFGVGRGGGRCGPDGCGGALGLLAAAAGQEGKAEGQRQEQGEGSFHVGSPSLF